MRLHGKRIAIFAHRRQLCKGGGRRRSGGSVAKARSTGEPLTLKNSTQRLADAQTAMINAQMSGNAQRMKEADEKLTDLQNQVKKLQGG